MKMFRISEPKNKSKAAAESLAAALTFRSDHDKLYLTYCLYRRGAHLGRSIVFSLEVWRANLI